jgi:curli biogenesis system outer membrane secretion channel CsgG
MSSLPVTRRVAIVLLAGLAGALAAGRPAVGGAQQPDAAPPAAPANDSRPTVAVLYFTNSALVGGTDYQPLSKGMAEMLITVLSQNAGVRVVERDRLQSLLEEQNLSTSGRVDQGSAVRVGRVLGAQHLLMGAFVIDPRQNMRIDVRSVNTETSQIEYVESVTGRSDQLLTLVDQLGRKVNAGLRLPPMPLRVRPISEQSSAKGPEQFRAVMLMSRALERQDRGDRSGAVALYQEALQADPGFERARVRLALLQTPGDGAQTRP